MASIWSGSAFIFGRTKQGKPLATPMHPKVELALRDLWEKRGRPKSGHVFLNRLGKPYADTRNYKIQGGNPLKKLMRPRPNGPGFSTSPCTTGDITGRAIVSWRGSILNRSGSWAGGLA